MALNRLLLTALVLLSCAVAQAQPVTIGAPGMTVEHTGFVMTTPDGKLLKGKQLQGAIVHMALAGGTVASIKLASITPDPADPDILRHEFQVQDDSGQWKSACEPNAYGETWGFPIGLPANHPGRDGAITLTCSSGAVGKCVRFGYKPWALGPHQENLTPYHAACVHLVRADYAGDGQPHTKNGTDIDIYDRIGIQSSESKANAAFAFEAGWAPAGAVCVAQTRWSDLLTLDALRKAVPRLAQKENCTEDRAAALGGLIFNRSKIAAEVSKVLPEQ